MAKKRTGVRRVRTPSGIRYMRGGKFISKAAAKSSRKRKRKATSAKPKRKRVTRKKVTRRRKPAVARKRVTRRKRNPVKRKKTARKRTTTRRKTVAKKRKSTKRARAARKAARTRAANRAKRSRAAKKAARTRKRRKSTRRTVSRKRVTRRRRRRNPVKRHRRKSVGRYKRVRRRRRKNPVANPRRRRRRRTVSRKRRVRRRRRNPGMKGVMKGLVGAVKRGAMFWAGLVGMRALNGVIKKQIQGMSFASTATGTTAKLIGVLPSLATVVGAGLLLPKVVKKRAVVEMVQMGAAVALFEAIYDNFIYDLLPASAQQYLPKSSVSGFGSYVSVPVSGMGRMGEYVDYDNRLGEYVDFDNRYSGFEVSESLADADMAYIQSGGAGGIFAKTSLGWG